jgi:hypothetical protein
MMYRNRTPMYRGHTAGKPGREPEEHLGKTESGKILSPKPDGVAHGFHFTGKKRQGQKA